MPMPTPTNTLYGITENTKFNIPGGDLYLLAENQIFKIHRHFFVRESIKFRDELATPVTRGGHARGAAKSDPIALAVRAVDLEKFLWVFYIPSYNLYDASAEDWITILTLAHEWGFGEVKNLALRELEGKQFPVVDRILLYRAHRADEEVLQRHYADLCMRPRPLSLQEGRQLGVDTVIMVAAVRERLSSIRSDDRQSSPPRGADRTDVERAVAQFLPELQRGGPESSDRGPKDLGGTSMPACHTRRRK